MYRFNASISANNTERVIQSGDKEPSDGGVQGENPANGSRTESETKAGNNSGDKESDDSNESDGQGENPGNGSRTESKTKAGNDSGDKESDDSNESEFDAFEVRICV